MKMKSKLFGNGAKLALTLLAMCGMFASCYEKDEIDVPKVTDPTATTYQVAGIVTDAESNAVMDGVTVTNVTNSKSMTTAADGKYVLEAKVGETNVVTFAKSGYKTVTSSVFVTKQENGSIVAYTIDAKMEKGKETKPTKDVEYQIEGSVFDAESGEPVAIKTATMPGILTATIQNGNEFTMSNVGLGQHTIYITADGYKPATADVVISEVAGPEGEGIFIAKTSVTVAMQKKEVEVAPKYYLAGNIYNQDGGMVTKAEVTLNMSGYEVTTTASNGFYKFEIPADKVKGLTKATVTIRHNSYKIYVYTAFIAPVDNGQVSNTTVNVTLILKPDTEKPNDDDNVFIGGNVEIEVPTENAVEAAPEKAEGEKQAKILAAEAEKQADELLKRVGLYDRKNAYPRELSGGQKQRIAIVRSLCMNPEIILFDEVTAALDPEMVREVLDVILGLAKDGMTMLIVTHEMNFARQVANRIVFMDKGQIIEQAKPEDFFTNPTTDRAKTFLNILNYEPRGTNYEENI